jgi:hypothetical protein
MLRFLKYQFLLCLKLIHLRRRIYQLLAFKSVCDMQWCAVPRIREANVRVLYHA